MMENSWMREALGHSRRISHCIKLNKSHLLLVKSNIHRLTPQWQLHEPLEAHIYTPLIAELTTVLILTDSNNGGSIINRLSLNISFRC